MVKRLKPSLSMYDIARLCDEHETLTADLARVTTDLDTARAEVARLTAEVERLTNYGDAREDDACEAIRERDEARDKCAVLLADALRLERERDEARAEVEAMREVVQAARASLVVTSDAGDSWDARRDLKDALDALDALRARKVGG